MARENSWTLQPERVWPATAKSGLQDVRFLTTTATVTSTCSSRKYPEFDLKTAAPPGKASNCMWKEMPVFCGPRGLPFGGANLYRNRGDGTFENVSARSKISEVKGFYAFTAIAADLTGDGWTDIYVACDSTPSLLFRNNRDGTFSEIGTEAGVAFNEHGFEQGGMGVAVGDFDGDGIIDLFKTNFTGDYPNVYRIPVKEFSRMLL